MLLPPARSGDVVSVLLNYRPHAIGLVDGVFRTSTAVLHKELLEAISQGVWVVGSSSMGALRAAECARFGMMGVGQVFEQYHSGALEDDDEVAVAHADQESGYRAFGQPMVTIRATLIQPAASEVCTAHEAQVLIDAQKARHFADRGFHGVLDTAKNELAWPESRIDRLREFIRENTIDVKADDARQLLETLLSLPDSRVPIDRRPAGHHSSAFMALLDRDRMVGLRDELPVSFDAIMRYVALNRTEHSGNRSRASRRQTLLQIGRVLDVQPSPDELMRSHLSLSARVGMSLDEWAAAVDLTSADLDRFTHEEAVLDKLEKWALHSRAADGYVRAYLDELRLAGLYPEMRRLAGEIEQFRPNPSQIQELTMTQTLQEHIDGTGWAPPRSWPSFMEESELGGTTGVFERLTTYVTAARGLPSEVAERPSTPSSSFAGETDLDEPMGSPLRSRGA
jgi:hypothetical protein